jgi:hypothetical protein
MFDDLRTALRSLRASPTFTTVALTVLALGIGAGTAIFSVVDAVVLRGLPFDEHDRLVAVLEHDTRRPETFGAGRTTPRPIWTGGSCRNRSRPSPASATRVPCACGARAESPSRRRDSA